MLRLFGKIVNGLDSLALSKKQPYKGVLKKRCSKNVQQIYKTTPTPKGDFKKVAKQLYRNDTSTWMFSLNLLYIFRTLFSKNTSGRLLLYICRKTSSKMSESVLNTALYRSILCVIIEYQVKSI